MGINSDRTNPAPRESGPVGQLPQCDHWYRNLRRPCVRTTACLNSRIPAAGVSAPCRLNKTQQSIIIIKAQGRHRERCRKFKRQHSGPPRSCSLCALHERVSLLSFAFPLIDLVGGSIIEIMFAFQAYLAMTTLAKHQIHIVLVSGRG